MFRCVWSDIKKKKISDVVFLLLRQLSNKLKFKRCRFTLLLEVTWPSSIIKKTPYRTVVYERPNMKIGKKSIRKTYRQINRKLIYKNVLWLSKTDDNQWSKCSWLVTDKLIYNCRRRTLSWTRESGVTEQTTNINWKVLNSLARKVKKKKTSNKIADRTIFLDSWCMQWCVKD